MGLQGYSPRTHTQAPPRALEPGVSKTFLVLWRALPVTGPKVGGYGTADGASKIPLQGAVSM